MTSKIHSRANNSMVLASKSLKPKTWLAVAVKVAQSCPTLWDPTDYTVHGFSRPEYWSG